MAVNQGLGDVGTGFGAIPSPPDSRDFQLTELMSAAPELLSIKLPSSFMVHKPPAVLNQGRSAMCVAYSSSSMKAWQDNIDEGRWYDFDEPRFFGLIGGTQSGASLRSAMDRLIKSGYPVNREGVVDSEGSHRIKAYYAADLNPDSLRTAILAYGPIILGVHWSFAWMEPESNGQLPEPSGDRSGHAILAVGWDDARGIRLRNSWGSAWGPKRGDCFLPYAYLDYVFEAWKAMDVIDLSSPPKTGA